MNTPTHDFKPGDLIRMDRDPISDYPVGNVYAVNPQGPCSPESVCFAAPGERNTWRPASYFSLIARAGEPVAYQSGDVVEVVTPGRDDAGGGTTTGQRLTLNRVEPPLSGFGRELSPEGYGYSEERQESVRLHCCRLVHRPDPVKAAEVAPTPDDYHDADSLAAATSLKATSPKTIADVAADLRPTINPGDTVTVRGVANHRLRRMIERGGVELLSHEPKPEPEPLKAGDRAKSSRHGVGGEIRAIESGHAWLWVGGYPSISCPLADLTRL